MTLEYVTKSFRRIKNSAKCIFSVFSYVYRCDPLLVDTLVRRIGEAWKHIEVVTEPIPRFWFDLDNHDGNMILMMMSMI